MLVLLGLLVVMGVASEDVYTISEMILYSMIGFSAMGTGMVLYEVEDDEERF
jgi:hypothetical protein